MHKCRRKEYERAQAEGHHRDQEWAHPLKQSTEVDVTHGCEADEGDGNKEACRLAALMRSVGVSRRHGSPRIKIDREPRGP